jgi:prepilin-type N-terminal cleavage/methylation domain-containing protein
MIWNKKAFTLIEVIVATSILSLSIFGIYKLIGENMRLLWTSSAMTTSALLLNNAKECIKSFWYSAFGTSWKYSLSFWTNNMSCATWSFVSNYSFSGVILDSKEYFLSAEILQTSTNFRNWRFEVFEESLWKKQIDWKQIQ